MGSVVKAFNGTFELLDPKSLCHHSWVHQLWDVVDENVGALRPLLVTEDINAGQNVVLCRELPYTQIISGNKS